MVAGEPSGDTLGAALISELRRRNAQTRFVGVGGPKMQQSGLVSLFPMDVLAVRGYVEVLRNFAKIVRMRAALVRKWLRDPPNVFIGIDAPDFNLGLEARLKAGGIPTVQYVSPQIWAWRPERAAKLKRAASLVLSVFPFESPLLEKEGIRARYIGHPLADMLPLVSDQSRARERLGIAKDARVVALLPGSRRGVVGNTAELYIRTAVLLSERIPQAIFAVALLNEETKKQFARVLSKLGMQALPISLFVASTYDVMAAADAILVTAGTASLEAALIKRPMVITYKLSTVSYWTLKHRIHGEHFGLPNILAGREVVPELIQDDATPEKLAAALLHALAGDSREMMDVFTELHRTLRQDSSRKAADAVLELVHA
jgi:lipid-A-disaccharide synthase